MIIQLILALLKNLKKKKIIQEVSKPESKEVSKPESEEVGNQQPPNEVFEQTILQIPAAHPNVITKLVDTDPRNLYKYMIKKLRTAIDNQQKNVILFQLQGNGIKIYLDSKTYQPTLENMIQICIRHEQYELANECQLLINKVHVNDLLTS